MEWLVLALAVPVIGLILALVALVAWIRSGRTQAYGDALVLAGGEVVLEDTFANNFGRTSLGRTQVRGNGALVLGSEALAFVQIAPRRPLEIPLSSILRVESARSHLGKTTASELVRIHFEVDGTEDSVAFAVREPARWFAELERAIERQAVSQAGSRASSSAAAARPRPQSQRT